jgi:hypothetical protein
MVEGSRTLTDVKETFFNGDPDYFKAQLKTVVDQFGLTAEDTKNLTLSAPSSPNSSASIQMRRRSTSSPA